VPSLRAPEGRGGRDRRPSDRAAAPLPADTARAGLLTVDDDRLPGADRPAQPLPREEERRRSLELTAGKPELRQDPVTRQWVVVSTPRHVRSFADLSEDELAGVALAWRERARAAREAGFPYVHALLNEGREAGASLPHNHTQLAWLKEEPPAVLVEEAGGDCSVCRHLEAELASGERLIAERDGLVLLAAYGGRLPYELLLAPRAHVESTAFESEL